MKDQRNHTSTKAKILALVKTLTVGGWGQPRTRMHAVMHCSAIYQSGRSIKSGPTADGSCSCALNIIHAPHVTPALWTK